MIKNSKFKKLSRLIGCIAVLAISVSAFAYEQKIPKELRLAAFKGDYEAQFSVGLAYYLEHDYPSAVAWWKRAVNSAQRDNERAFKFRCSAFDLFVPDQNEALIWMEMAADEGILEAQFELGLVYENGDGRRRNYKKAVEWYRKAAEQGYVDAQYVLETLGVEYKVLNDYLD